MRQNIDKQHNINTGIYNSFTNNAHIFIRTKALDPLICTIWGALKCHKRLEQELLVLRSEINAAPRPEGAQSALGLRPQAVAFPSSHLPEPNPKESWLFPGGLLQAPGGEEPRPLGWVLPTKHFFRAGAQRLGRLATPRCSPIPPGGGRGRRAPSARGRGVPGLGGGAGRPSP